jgi:hypothetical protein
MYRLTAFRYHKKIIGAGLSNVLDPDNIMDVAYLLETQTAIIKVLPDDRSDKEKARLALLAATESYRLAGRAKSRKILTVAKNHYIGALEADRKFLKAAETFLVCLDNLGRLDNLLRIGAEKAGITVEQIRLAISEALNNKRKRIHLPKEESKNPITRKGLHDIAVGRVLVNNGINRKEAARVLAKLRKKLHSLYANFDSKKSGLVEDIDKETRSIEQRLRDHGI